MRSIGFQIIFIIALAGLITPSSRAGSSLESLYRTVRSYSPEDTCLLPSPETIRRFESLFTRFVRIHESRRYSDFRKLKTDAENLSLMISRVRGPDGITVSVLSESLSRRGRGFYVLRDKPPRTRPVIIQSPHARSDAGTGWIGLRAFCDSGAAGFFSSTMRRHTRALPEKTSPKTPDADTAADPAHNPNLFFQAATRAYASIHPDMMIVQLHGFKESSDTPSRNFDVVVSYGRPPRKDLAVHRKIRDSIRKNLKERRVGMFGTDTPELGAMTNVQARLINSRGAGLFLHIELGAGYRKTLRSDAKAMARFVRMLRKVRRCYEKH